MKKTPRGQFARGGWFMVCRRSWVLPWHGNNLEELRLGLHWQVLVHYQWVFSPSWHDIKPGHSNKGLLYKQWFIYVIALTGNKLIIRFSSTVTIIYVFPSDKWYPGECRPCVAGATRGGSQAAHSLALHPKPSLAPLSRLKIRCCMKTWQQGTWHLSERGQADWDPGMNLQHQHFSFIKGEI